jgi:hypothetical protein
LLALVAPQPQIVQIALDVARGLAYIHDRNVIHGGGLVKLSLNRIELNKLC